MNQLIKVFCFLSLFSLLACPQKRDAPAEPTIPVKEKEVETPKHNFNSYWYSGKAELNSYALKQSRYGEIREGEVVLVFVTEPFSLSKQVKLDNPQAAGEDHVPIMKLNSIRKFTTGVYDYSVVTSTFTPVDFIKYPNTLKLNTSIQEWCGHTFTQLNLKEANYHFQEFSYFEADGDTEKEIPAALLEDELMTRIRLNKGELPLGEVDMIFSTLYSRFAHKELKVAKAKISKTASDFVITYHIDYLNDNRKISMDVENEFPYKILSWTEDSGDGLVTEARLLRTLNEPYWEQKGLKDEALRRELQLRR